MERRAFLGTFLAGLPITRAFAAQPKPKAVDIPTTVLGKTDVDSRSSRRVGPDGSASGHLVGGRRRSPGPRAWRAVLRLRADVLERPVGEAYGLGLQGVRQSVFLTSKSVGRTAKDAEKDLETSLRHLKTDYIDLRRRQRAANTLENLNDAPRAPSARLGCRWLAASAPTKQYLGQESDDEA